MTTRSPGSKQASTASTPVARLQQAATDLGEHGFEEGLQRLGRRKDSDKPTIDGTLRQKQARVTDTEKSDGSGRVAREHGVQGDEAEFKGVSRKKAKPKS